MAINPINFTGALAASAPTQAAPTKEEAAPPVQPAAPSPTQGDDLSKALQAIQNAVESLTPNRLQVSVDNNSGKTIVVITDARDSRVIRQIPSEELLEISRSIDGLQGLLLRGEA